MISFVKSCTTGLKQFGHARKEWGCWCLVLAGAVGLLWFGGRMSGWALGFSWVLLLTLLALLLRRGWIKLVGPVFLYYMVRNARRRVIALRCLYAGMLFCTLLFTFALVLDEQGGPNFWNLLFTSVVPRDVLTALAAGFFAAFMGVQFVVACLLTPSAVASAIPEEKQRRTLEFLLATD